MNSNEQTCTARTFEQSALLRVLGFRFIGARRGDKRVSLLFDDPEGKAEKALERHAADGVPINSRKFEEGLSWAKREIFSAKDAA